MLAFYILIYYYFKQQSNIINPLTGSVKMLNVTFKALKCFNTIILIIVRMIVYMSNSLARIYM